MEEYARPVATDRAERESTEYKIMMAIRRLVVACGLPVSYDDHVEIEVEVTNDFLVPAGADWRVDVVSRDEAG